jgi:hypothetical protein
VVIQYLNLRYKLPQGWKDYTLDLNNMDLYVKEEKRFLAKREHVGFFRSFCTKVKEAKKDDIVLTRTECGVAINRFAYWVWSEDKQHVIHKKMNKDCLILRVDHG